MRCFHFAHLFIVYLFLRHMYSNPRCYYPVWISIELYTCKWNRYCFTIKQRKKRIHVHSTQTKQTNA